MLTISLTKIVVAISVMADGSGVITTQHNNKKSCEENEKKQKWINN